MCIRFLNSGLNRVRILVTVIPRLTVAHRILTNLLDSIAGKREEPA